MPCPICAHPDGRTHTATERMFGMPGRFTYFECAACGCLSLTRPPDDLAAYYPPDRYYSKNRTPARGTLIPLPLARWRDRRTLFGPPNALLPRLLRNREARELRTYVADSPNRSFSTRILDVGCGGGELLHRLAALGFTHLDGIDPFLADATPAAPPVRLRKLHAHDLPALGEQYDLILMNHALEHIPDQVGTLRALAQTLAPAGVIRIEIPVADSRAWREYGLDWAELDAPRHLYLHTRRSLPLAARNAGLEVYRTDPASISFEFWGSELYRRGLTLYDATTHAYRTPATLFTPAEMLAFDRRAEEVNRTNESGRAAFYLRRLIPSPPVLRGRGPG